MQRLLIFNFFFQLIILPCIYYQTICCLKMQKIAIAARNQEWWHFQTQNMLSNIKYSKMAGLLQIIRRSLLGNGKCVIVLREKIMIDLSVREIWQESRLILLGHGRNFHRLLIIIIINTCWELDPFATAFRFFPSGSVDVLHPNY